ncbi:MAG TPA: hypothetical protein VF637_08560 [Sphingomicrobium sp.]|jgi:hypothetical protein
MGTSLLTLADDRPFAIHFVRKRDGIADAGWERSGRGNVAEQ